MPPYPLTRSDNMYRTRRQASHTLPRNFTFHYTDGLGPTTPEPQASGSPPAPPSPPRQTYRLKRRRGARQLSSEFSEILELGQMPIPTIEFPDSTIEDVPMTSSSYRPRMGSRRRSLPRTPSAQFAESSPNDGAMDEVADAASQGESISRPSTACSGFSDSSVSSSLESFPSLGTSFTSPELETDQKVWPEHQNGPELAAAYSSEPLPQITYKSDSKRPKSKWTEDMDNHLWMTYLRYLQDATRTPFRTAPGAPPPLGICSRIVREAKRTWKGGRTPALNDRLHPWSLVVRADSPDTIKPATSGSTTPTGVRKPKSQLSWPRSDAATRRRFRELCKRRAAHPSHYNRMLASRTPPPFSMVGNSRVNKDLDSQAPLNTNSSFSTRDMSISLFSSTSSAISALHQVTIDMTPSNQSSSGPSVFTATPRVGSHQKSQSLHLGDSRTQGNLHLASPFQPMTRNQYGEGHSLETPTGRPGLASPLQLQSGVGGFGRQETDSITPFPPATFVQPYEGGFPGISARRVRTRGFSLGDVNESSRRLTQIFDPSTMSEQPVPSPAITGLAPPPVIVPTYGIQRLGSPFTEQPRAHFHTFPRNLSLHSLEPALEVHEDRQNFDFLSNKMLEKSSGL